MEDLLLNPGLGLLNGKMGIAVYKLHYARTYQNEDYEDRAMKLIAEIQNTININTPIAYATGLSGIGSAICYLIHEGFIEANEDEVLSDFDNRLFHAIYSEKHTDLSRNTGLIGIGCYFINRIRGLKANNNNRSTLLNKYLLMIIQDIILARFKVNGYTYPFADNIPLTNRELIDIKQFLYHMSKLKLCGELTDSITPIVESMVKNDSSIIALIQKAAFDDDRHLLNYHLNKLAVSPVDTVEKQLATLSLRDPLLPHWWELF